MTPIELRPFHSYRATVRFRRNEKYVVMPHREAAVEALDGRTFVFETLWRIGEEESDIYGGEVAMKAPEVDAAGLYWIASGDLEILEEVST